MTVSATSEARRRSRTIVGIGDMKADSGRGELMTFALGSCVGVTVYDPVHHVGAMLHAMLPSVRYASSRTKDNSWLFVDTGVPEMFRRVYELGGEKGRLEVCVAGGAKLLLSSTSDLFQVGAKNVAMVTALLEKNRVPVKSWHIGGSHARTLTLRLDSGKVDLQAGREKLVL